MITQAQLIVLRYIESEIHRTGMAPTLREIQEHCGYKAIGSVQGHVRRLIERGYLRRQDHLRRGLEVIKAAPKPEGPLLLGSVAAGLPIEAVDQPEPVDLAGFLLPPDDDCFLLRVEGDSMIDDGIHDDDLVIVRPAQTARDGEIVVAMVDGEATLKRLYREGGGMVRLEPANADHEAMHFAAEEVKIQGILVGLARRY